MMKIRTIIFLALTMLVLTACGGEDTSQSEGSLSANDIKDLVNDYTVDNLEPDSASITSHELVVEEDNEELVYELPEEEFFVSIAPFINETHECAVHSLTGCQGELVEEEIDVLITDSSGEVVVDETMTTEENGFIDLWLPRDETFVVEMTQGSRTTEAKISTFEGDKTCITTMQLK